MLNLTIVGRGAIGTLLAARCIEQNIAFQMWWRDAVTTPLSITMKDGKQHQFQQGKGQAPDILILPLKAWQIAPALDEFAEHIPTSCCIALLHNGIGTETLALNAFPDNPLVRLTTNRAAKKQQDTVLETGYGNSQAGWLRTPGDQVKQETEALFNRLLSPCEWHRDIRIPLWNKLAINCVINPLTAIHNIANGGLQSPHYQQLIAQLLDEFLLVAQAEKLTFEKSDLEHNVSQVIAMTAENYSSMHQDIHFKRPTEIDYINGYLLQVAASHGITLTAHQALYAQIRQLESV
ncbi:ketopantoate reductase family protein [Planctobacterium marinum]|uniref:ketopantoate reductase family protein n=1 Tax=Planctobacterium marinum TaxID=1631968 RepID=UPI001E42B19F|nr:2-dehydropantoate 2-reductase [Planctobacterium marinum]MCC2606001.1 2-dehydropantoate 2-reductase [Planctobacterium marinum]